MIKTAATFISTLDNPYDFFDEFEEWYACDTQKGYNTCAYVARLANVTSDMSPKDYEDAVNDAVKQIAKLNITGNYIIVSENDPNRPSSRHKIERTTA